MPRLQHNWGTMELYSIVRVPWSCTSEETSLQKLENGLTRGISTLVEYEQSYLKPSLPSEKQVEILPNPNPIQTSGFGVSVNGAQAQPVLPEGKLEFSLFATKPTARSPRADTSFHLLLIDNRSSLYVFLV